MANTYIPPPNDKLSDFLEALVPVKYKGTDRFLDIVTWNLRWFHGRDPERVTRIVEIMDAISADIFVLQEVKEGSLTDVSTRLVASGAGHYETQYGTTGGDQRVAIMYDLDWIRAKSPIEELFGRGAVRTRDGKDAFPRLPLVGHFGCLSPGQDPYDFQLMGLHLKSQMGDGSPQRRLAASKLASWLTRDAAQVDSDVIMLGDWNAPPQAPEWRPIRTLETTKRAAFRTLNETGEISYLMYKNRASIGTRIDLAIVSTASLPRLHGRPQVIQWRSLVELLARSPSAREIESFIRELGTMVSDHMPLVARFYFAEPE